MATETYRQQWKRNTAAGFASDNPTLLPGEPGYETDTGRIKIGDGTTAWNSLEYTKPYVERDLVNDISATDVTITPTITRVQNGDQFYYAWQDGDGTNEFKLANPSGWTIAGANGTTLDTTALGRIGEGTGFIKLEADADSSVLNIIGYSDNISVADSSSQVDRIIRKYIDGAAKFTGTVEFSGDIDNLIGGLYYSITATVSYGYTFNTIESVQNPVAIGGTSTARWVLSFSGTTTGYGFRIVYGDTTTGYTRDFGCSANGTWY